MSMRTAQFATLMIIVLVAICIAFRGTVVAQGDSANPTLTTQLRAALVYIERRVPGAKEPCDLGSGVAFASEPGLTRILTARHVVDGAKSCPDKSARVVVRWDHPSPGRAQAKRIVSSEDADISFVEVENVPELAVLPIDAAYHDASPTAVAVASWPKRAIELKDLGLGLVPTLDYSASIIASYPIPKTLGLKASASAGSSGGPVVDEHSGGLIGIVTDIDDTDATKIYAVVSDRVIIPFLRSRHVPFQTPQQFAKERSAITGKWALKGSAYGSQRFGGAPPYFCYYETSMEITQLSFDVSNDRRVTGAVLEAKMTERISSQLAAIGGPTPAPLCSRVKTLNPEVQRFVLAAPTIIGGEIAATFHGADENHAHSNARFSGTVRPSGLIVGKIAFTRDDSPIPFFNWDIQFDVDLQSHPAS